MFNFDLKIILGKVITSDYVHVIDDFPIDRQFFLNLLKDQILMREKDVSYPGTVKNLGMAELNDFQRMFCSFLDLERVGHLARLRITSAKDNGTQRTWIHTDSNMIQILVYIDLPREGQEDQGTSFYFHPKYSEKKCPHYTTPGRVERYNLLISDHYFSQWVCWKKVQSKIMRAIIFDGHLFHSGPILLTGDGENDRRITLEISLLRSGVAEVLGIDLKDDL